MSKRKDKQRAKYTREGQEARNALAEGRPIDPSNLATEWGTSRAEVEFFMRSTEKSRRQRGRQRTRRDRSDLDYRGGE